jgi:hypothetical protein
MTKRLCEASSIALLHCHSGYVINCRPVSVLAVFQESAVARFYVFRLNEMDTVVTGLDWGVQGSPASPSSLYNTIFFILLCLLDCDLLMELLSISRMIDE